MLHEIKLPRTPTFGEVMKIYDTAISFDSILPLHQFSFYATDLENSVEMKCNEPVKNSHAKFTVDVYENNTPVVQLAQEFYEERKNRQDLDSEDIFVRNAPLIRERRINQNMESEIFYKPVGEAALYRRSIHVGRMFAYLRTSFVGDRTMIIRSSMEGECVAKYYVWTRKEEQRIEALFDSLLTRPPMLKERLTMTDVLQLQP